MALVAASVLHVFLLIGLLSGVVTQQTTDFQSNNNETQFLSLLFVFGPFCFCASFIALLLYSSDDLLLCQFYLRSNKEASALSRYCSLKYLLSVGVNI